jgi:hypothetical protein
MGLILSIFGTLLCVNASASIIVYTTTLLGSNEVPPTGSSGMGFATVTLDTIANTLKVQESFSGLTGPAAAAHIHCCGPIGMNEPVAVPFTTFPTATSGTFIGTFDLTLAGTYTASFITAEGGTVSGAEAALIAALASGQTYANIHTALYPGGEIRGQLSLAPEPATWGIAGMALYALIRLRRRHTTG